jgi:hypothetical protein
VVWLMELIVLWLMQLVVQCLVMVGFAHGRSLVCLVQSLVPRGTTETQTGRSNSGRRSRLRKMLGQSKSQAVADGATSGEVTRDLQGVTGKPGGEQLSARLFNGDKPDFSTAISQTLSRFFSLQQRTKSFCTIM